MFIFNNIISAYALTSLHPLYPPICSTYALPFTFFVGKYLEAEKLYLRCIGLQKEVLGEKHPDTLSSMHNLGTIYDDQGKYTGM